VPDDLPLSPGNQAVLKVVHASPDAPVVDISTAGSGPLKLPILVEDLAFGEIAADVVALPSAELEIGLAPAGSTDPVAIFAVTTTPGLRGILVAIGALTPAADEEALRLILVNTSVRPWVAIDLEQVPPD
jgi:hypothetical protein